MIELAASWSAQARELEFEVVVRLSKFERHRVFWVIEPGEPDLVDSDLFELRFAVNEPAEMVVVLMCPNDDVEGRAGGLSGDVGNDLLDPSDRLAAVAKRSAVDQEPATVGHRS